MTGLTVPRRTPAAVALAAVFASATLGGCRAGVQVPPASGQGGPGLNASGEQRTFTGAELVEKPPRPRLQSPRCSRTRGRHRVPR